MGQPKTLLTFRGETFLDRLIGLLETHCFEVIVVVRSDFEPSLYQRTAKFTINESPEQGMLSSLQCGLTAVSPKAEAILFCPVDYAPVEAESIEKLTVGFNGFLALPLYEGKRGHPCMISRTLGDELLRLPVTASAKNVIHAHLAQAVLVPVTDRRTVDDIDDPEAYRQLLKEEAIHVKG